MPRTFPPAIRDYLGVSVFWFAVSVFWGAMLTIVLPARVEELFGPDAKDRNLALLSSAGALVASITQIVFGALSDRSTHRAGRRKPFLLVGTLGTCVALFAFPPARTFAAILGAFCLLQFWVNVATGPYQALMADQIPTNFHGRASSFLGIATLLGRIGGPLGATILLARGQNGLAWLFAGFALVFLGALGATLALVRETPFRETAKVSLGERLRAIWQVPLKPYPSFVWMMISRAGIMLGVYTVNFCLLFYIRDTLGFNAKDSLGIATNFLLISTIAGLCGTIPSGKFADKWGKKRVLYVANSICMASGLAFALAGDLRIAYFAAAIFGAGYGAFAAVDWALACSLLPAREPAKYMGVWGISDTMSQVVAPLVAGPLAAFINASTPGLGYRALMICSLVYFALGTVAIRFIKEPART